MKNNYIIWIILGIAVIIFLQPKEIVKTQQNLTSKSVDISYSGGGGSAGNAGTNPEENFISFKFFSPNHTQVDSNKGLFAIVNGVEGIKYAQITITVKNTGNSVLNCIPLNFTPSVWDNAVTKSDKTISAGDSASWTSGDIDLDTIATAEGSVRFTATVQCSHNGIPLPVKSGYGDLIIRPDAINSYEVIININNTYQCATISNILGLSLYLPFNSNVNDYSGNSFNGNIHGATFDSSGGKFGDGAYVFDGINDYIEIPDEPQFSPSNNGNSLTISAWIRPDSFSFRGESQGYNHFMGKGGQNGDYEWMWRIYNSTAVDGVSRSKRISFYGFNLEGGLGAGSYFQDNLIENEWIFITGVFDGTNVKIYKNGVLRDTDPLSGYSIIFQDGTAPVRIGTSDSDSFFKGSIDEVRIYNRALSDAEILEIYNLNSCTYI